MLNRHPFYPGGARWSIDRIPYHALAREQVNEDRQLFYLIASASFIEITTELYTSNLVEFFRNDRDLVEWLERCWMSEELQHGAALKRYVETAWPSFDWEAAYRRFLTEYSQLCAVDRLGPTPALELAARCVVETGTASFYRMLAALSPEPVLRQLASEISKDEVRHYKQFYRYFRRYRDSEQLGRIAVLRTLWNRVGEIDAEDAYYAFKHVHLASSSGAEFHKRDYEVFRNGVRRLARRHFPREMAVKMLMQPLDLPAPVRRSVLPAITSAARLALLA